MIDLRSDTVTEPTEGMREAMRNAEVGDDVYGSDPTVKMLERESARAMGKESALFVPSGTFGNQLAIFVHCERGNEVILSDDCHIVSHEAGGAAIIAGVQLRTISNTLSAEEVHKRIRATENIHYPKTGLICLENAHSNGRVMSVEKMSEIYKVAKQNNIPLHLDGARIYNAAVSLNVDVKEIAKYTDTIMFCLSKGLCAPIGSMLVGDKEFIEKARNARKILGGGLRQAGFLAAAGLIALKEMTKRLNVDHENAKFLGEELSKIEGIRILQEDIQINMVFFDMTRTAYASEKLVKEFLTEGIHINGEEDGLMRFVTHNGVSCEDINKVVTLMKKLLSA